MRIVFLARSLEIGGSDRQLVALARGLASRGHDVIVVLFYGGGPLERELDGTGVRLETLEKRGRWHLLGFLTRLASLLRQLDADLYHGYLPTPNLLLALMRPVLPGPVVFGVRASFMDISKYGWIEALVRQAEIRMARHANAVIANSEAGAAMYRRAGVPADKLFVVPNGVDTLRFVPDATARGRGRDILDVGDSDQLVGLIARLDPMKGHSSFLLAAAQLVRDRPKLRFACVGPGPLKSELEAECARLGLRDRVRWTGAVSDIVAIYNACDVVVLTSSGEGFPNSIAEAMSCGVPCVVTDVGDARSLVGDTGRVVAVGDSEGLASGIANLLDLIPQRRNAIGAAARARIEANYGQDALVDRSLAVMLSGMRSCAQPIARR